MTASSEKVARDDRALIWLAILTLAIAMGAHQLTETARDALFLAELGPTRLPLVYLMLALIGAPIALMRAGMSAKRSHLALVLAVCAPVTASFWWMSQQPWDYVFQALYVWTGISTTVFVTFFWLALSHHHSMTDAKRIFPRVALGGIVGAFLGAGIARIATELVSTRSLLLIAGGLTAVGAVFAWRLERTMGTATPAVTEGRERPATPFTEMIRRAVDSRYARVVGLLLVLASMTFTVLDYTFKTVVTELVPKAELASLFATLYLALNAIALLSQALLAQRLVLWLGLASVLLLLPGSVLVGAGALLAGGGLSAALALKGIDGGMRHSLHRTSCELLYVPMSEETRTLVKPVFDIIGTRGGQALASVGIIVLLEFSADAKLFAALTAGLALAWSITAIGSRRLYLDMFRNALREHSVETRLPLPDLEVGSLAALVAQLNSDNDGVVVSTIDMLVAHDHAALVPDLILYHPSPEVVAKSLRQFATEPRLGVRPIVRRLERHSDGRVRAEALLYLAQVEPDTNHASAFVEDDSPLVRGVAIGLSLDADADRTALEACLLEGADEDRLGIQTGFARAFGLLDARVRRLVDAEIVARLPPDAQESIADAIATSATQNEIKSLIALLGVRAARGPVRRALARLGPPALEACRKALADTATPLAVRLHLPRTVSRFPANEAAPVLLERLVDEEDELVFHKALRGLGRVMASHPQLELDEETLFGVCERTIDRTTTIIQTRRSLSMIRNGESGRSGAIRDALLALLAEGERRGVEHVFRVLHLLYPTDQLEEVFRSIKSDDADRRSSALELLTNLLEWRLRAGVMALVNDDDATLPPISERQSIRLLLKEDIGPLGHAAVRYAELFGIDSQGDADDEPEGSLEESFA